MVTVRTAIRPDLEHEVSEREAYGLRQGGLLHEGDAPEQDPSADANAPGEDQVVADANEAERQNQATSQDATDKAAQSRDATDKATPRSQAKTKSTERS